MSKQLSSSLIPRGHEPQLHSENRVSHSSVQKTLQTMNLEMRLMTVENGRGRLNRFLGSDFAAIMVKKATTYPVLTEVTFRKCRIVFVTPQDTQGNLIPHYLTPLSTILFLKWKVCILSPRCETCLYPFISQYPEAIFPI